MSDAAPLSRHPEGSLRELLTVALPLMISTGSHSVMIFCDRLFLTRVGKAELGAALSGGIVQWSLLAIPLGTLGYASTFVSQYVGAGDDRGARAAVWQSFWMGLVTGCLLLTAVPAAGWIFDRFDHPPTLRQMEAQYFAILLFAGLPRLAIGAFFCHYAGRGRTTVPMLAGLVGNAANIAISYTLIFGKAGLPAMGLAGAAWGTVIASVFELIFYGLYIVARERETLPLWWQTRAFQPRLAGRLISFGLPSGLQMASDAFTISIALLLIGNLGEDAMAATTLTFSLNAIVFVPLIGLGMAVGTIVGHRIGAERPKLARRSVRLACLIGFAMMGTFALACVVAPDLVLWPYDAYGREEFLEVRPTVVTLLRYLAAFALFDTLAVLMGFAIRGAGDTRFSLWLLVFTGWGLLVAPLWTLAKTERLTLDLCWLTLTAVIAVQGVAFTLRYLGGKWESMSVREPEPFPPGLASERVAPRDDTAAPDATSPTASPLAGDEPTEPAAQPSDPKNGEG